MKGHISKQTFKLIGATSVAIFSLIAVFTATAAWFEANRVHNNSADDMLVTKTPGAFQSISFHEYIGSYEYYLTGTLSGATADTYNDIYGLEKIPEKKDGQDQYASNIVSLKNGNSFKVRTGGTTGDDGIYGGTNSYSVASDGKYVVYFCPEGGINDWSANGGYFNVVSVSDSEYRYSLNGIKRLLSGGANEKTLTGISLKKGDVINFSNSAKTYGYANLKTTEGNANSSFSGKGSNLVCETSGVFDFTIDVTAAADAPAIFVQQGSSTEIEGAYYFQEEAKDTLTYNWTSNSVEAENDYDVELGRYSILDKHHPVLCIFTFNDPLGRPVTIDASTANPFLATQDVIRAEGNPLSSIVKFSSELGTKTDDEGHYCYSKKRLEENFSSFATITNNVPAFPAPVDGTYSANLWSGSLGEQRTLSMVVDYYPELIEYIYGRFIGNPLLSGESTITFSRDWRLVVE